MCRACVHYVTRLSAAEADAAAAEHTGACISQKWAYWLRGASLTGRV